VSKHTSKYAHYKGRLQATLVRWAGLRPLADCPSAAGQWIKSTFEPTGHFDFYFCSEYVRAMETSAFLNLPGAKFVTDFYIRCGLS